MTLLEGGHVLGIEFTTTVAGREDARPVWAEQARRLRGMGYGRVT